MTERVDEWVQRVLLEHDIPWERALVSEHIDAGFFLISGISRLAYRVEIPIAWPREAAALASDMLRRHIALQRRLLGTENDASRDPRAKDDIVDAVAWSRRA